MENSQLAKNVIMHGKEMVLHFDNKHMPTICGRLDFVSTGAAADVGKSPFEITDLSPSQSKAGTSLLTLSCTDLDHTLNLLCQMNIIAPDTARKIDPKFKMDETILNPEGDFPLKNNKLL